MSLKEKFDSLLEEEAFKLLITDALLLFKRPLAMDGSYARTSWNKKKYEKMELMELVIT